MRRKDKQLTYTMRANALEAETARFNAKQAGKFIADSELEKLKLWPPDPVEDKE